MARQPLDDKGVSEIIGALMLILIVVIAAAGIAMIVSQAEQQQASRQTLQDAINNEKLNMMYIQPIYNTNDTSSLGLTGIYPLTEIDIDIQNLNVQQSNIQYITVNGIPYNISELPGSLGDVLTVPASANLPIKLYVSNFLLNLDLYNNQSITVQIGTSYGNTFSRTINPPTASAKFNVESENLGLVERDYVQLDASASNDSTGQIKIYQWDITDNSPYWWKYLPTNNYQINSSGSTVQFNPLTNGPFTINLTVWDNQNEANAMIGQMNDIYIPADPNFDPPLTLSPIYYQNNSTIVATLTSLSGIPCSNQAIVFQPGSNINVNTTQVLTDSNGIAVVNVSFIPNATLGSVTVSYNKLTENVQVTLLPIPPIADFTSNITSGVEPLTVAFADKSSGGTYGYMTSWEWDFDDGTANSTLKNPVHTFNGPGIYTVTLTSTNSYGSVSKQYPNYITVHNGDPVANFTADITNGSPGVNVNFTDTSTGFNITSWTWNFGDNSTSNTENTGHVYSQPGYYTVLLTVANEVGSNTMTKTNYINIT